MCKNIVQWVKSAFIKTILQLFLTTMWKFSNVVTKWLTTCSCATRMLCAFRICICHRTWFLWPYELLPIQKCTSVVENVCIQVVVHPCDEYCRLGDLSVMESLNIFVVTMQAMFDACYACVRQPKRISRRNLQLCWFPMTLPISHLLQVRSDYGSGLEFILKTHAKMFKNP